MFPFFMSWLMAARPPSCLSLASTPTLVPHPLAATASWRGTNKAATVITNDPCQIINHGASEVSSRSDTTVQGSGDNMDLQTVRVKLQVYVGPRLSKLRLNVFAPFSASFSQLLVVTGLSGLLSLPLDCV